MIPAAELATMTTVLLSALDMTVSVLRNTRTPDGQLGFTEAWTAAYPSMPCRVRRMPGIEGVIAQQLLGKVRKTLLFPATYVLLHKDRVVAQGVTYQVVEPPTTSSYSVLLNATIEQIEEQG